MRPIGGLEAPEPGGKTGARARPRPGTSELRRQQTGQHLRDNAHLQLNIIRRCVMWGHTNIGKIFSLILLIILDTISSLSLTAIEVPKYAKVVA